MAATFVCGGECRIAIVGATNAPAEPHWSTISGTPAISTTTVRTGAASIRCNAAGAAVFIAQTVSQTVVSGRVYVRWASFPGSTSHWLTLLQAGGDGLLRVTSGGQITIQVVGSAGATNVGSAVSLNTWYRIDFEYDSSGATTTFKAQIDGGTEATNSFAQTSAPVTSIRFGPQLAVTSDMFFDDILLGNATGEYPWGGGTVEGLSPTADGTHSFTAGDFGYDTAGGDVATNATDVFGKLDDADLTSTSDLIRQKVVRSTGYVEVGGFTPSSSEDPQAINVVISTHAAGTGADTMGWKIVDGAGASAVNDAAGDGRSDVSNTTIGFIDQTFATQPNVGGAWTHSALLAVKIRGGYSDDVNAIPYWDGVMLEVAFPEGGGATTVEGSFTGNAVIKREQTASLTANAVLKRFDQPGSITANAVIRRLNQPGSFAADAVLKATIAGSLTANAVLKRFDQPGSFTGDAVIKRSNQPGSFTADAAIAVNVLGSITANAVLKATISASFTVDSVLRKTQSATFTLDAVLRRTQGFAEDTFLDTFTRTTSPGWDTADIGGSWTHNDASRFSTNGSEGVAAIVNPNGSLLSARLAAVSILNVDETVKVKADVFEATGIVDAFVGSRHTGDVTTGYVARLIWAPYDFSGNSLNIFVNKDLTDSIGSATLEGREGRPVANTYYYVRFRVTDISPTHLQCKVWKEGNPEPSGWDVDIYDSTSGYQRPGSVSLTAHWGDADTGTFPVTFDEFREDTGFRLDAVLRKTQSTSFTADSVLRKTQSATFTLDAAIATLVGEDTFTRTVAPNLIGWGRSTPTGAFDWVSVVNTRFGALDSVDGSVAHVSGAGSSSFNQLTGYPILRSGVFQIDFQFQDAFGFGNLWFIRLGFAEGSDINGWILACQRGENPDDLEVEDTFGNFDTVGGLVDGDWVTVQVHGHRTSGTPTVLKIWKRTDPEPAGTNSQADSRNIGSTPRFLVPNDQGGELLFDNAKWWSSESWSFYPFITADAIKQRTQNASFTANAVLRATQTATFTADAVVFRTQSASFTADAVVLRTQSASFTADAVLAVGTVTVQGSFTADAVIFRTQLASFTADAVLRREQTASLAADAVIVRAQSATVTADSVILRTQTASLTADAVLFKTISATFTADAVLRREQTATFTADAILLRTQAASFTADAVVLRTQVGSFTADAVIKAPVSASFTADAVLRRQQSATFTLDAVISVARSASLTADAVLLRTQTASLTVDAALFKAQSATFTADAVLRATQTSSFTLDAVTGFVGRCIWTTPENHASMSQTPTLAFLMPASTGPMHFHIELDTVDTFDSPDLRTYLSRTDQTGWEYWDGGAWQPITQPGVDPSFGGNEARLTIGDPPLTTAIWYRRVRAEVI